MRVGRSGLAGLGVPSRAGLAVVDRKTGIDRSLDRHSHTSVYSPLQAKSQVARMPCMHASLCPLCSVGLGIPPAPSPLRSRARRIAVFCVGCLAPRPYCATKASGRAPRHPGIRSRDASSRISRHPGIRSRHAPPRHPAACRATQASGRVMRHRGIRPRRAPHHAPPRHPVASHATRASGRVRHAHGLLRACCSPQARRRRPSDTTH